jgi:hypothetical protein
MRQFGTVVIYQLYSGVHADERPRRGHGIGRHVRHGCRNLQSHLGPLDRFLAHLLFTGACALHILGVLRVVPIKNEGQGVA